MSKSDLLKGQTALVTGANSGIGEAVAIAMGASGANVVVNYVSRPEDAEKVVSQIKTSGGSAIAIQADVSNESEVRTIPLCTGSSKGVFKKRSGGRKKFGCREDYLHEQCAPGDTLGRACKLCRQQRGH